MPENKISIEEFKNVVAATFDQFSEVRWHGLTFHIKHNLSLEEMMTFVSDVVSSCFEMETNEYLPEVKDFVTRCCILESYAGFHLPESVSEKYDMVYGSDIVAFVVGYVEKGQFNAMLSAIDHKIEHLAQSNIEALNKQMNEIISEFSALERNLSDIFGGIDSDTVTKLASALADGAFDERKLVDAFSSATPASDIPLAKATGSKVVQMQKRGE